MLNYTENYQLSQWVKSDRVLMEDFNDVNKKIDAAIANIPLVRITDVTLSVETSQFCLPLGNIKWEDYVELLLMVRLTTAANQPSLSVYLDGDTSNNYYANWSDYPQASLLSTVLGTSVTSMVIRIPYAYVGFSVESITQSSAGGLAPVFQQAYYGNRQKLRSEFQTMDFACSGNMSAGSRFALLGVKI